MQLSKFPITKNSTPALKARMIIYKDVINEHVKTRSKAINKE